MKVICLLPVRNGAPDLPGYFESVARFADGVVALDDGSTDETRAILQREPFVVTLLTNPVRGDYRGWNDSTNRNRLLQAAGQFSPDWIISIDADERIDEGDGFALRAFLESDALPGVAYSFRWYTMVGDLNQALPEPIWVHRLFAYVPGQRFPSQELHFAPIPTAIPRRAYVRTTFRIQHLAGLSKERRLARYEKYREADPDVRFAYDYSRLLNEPDPNNLTRWQARDPSTMPLFSGALDEATSGSVKPDSVGWAYDISIVVIDDGTDAGVRRALASSLQPASVSVEVLFVTDDAPRPEFHEAVRVLRLDNGASPEERRMAGVAAVQGRYVLMLDGDIALSQGAIDGIAAAHERGFASITGTVVNRATHPIPATVYQRRFSMLREGLPESVIERAPPWASRARDMLLPVAVDETAMGRQFVDLNYVTLRLAEPLLEFHGDSFRSPRAGFAWAFRHGEAVARIQLERHTIRAIQGERPVQRQQPSRQRRSKRRAEPAANKGIRYLLGVAETLGRWTELMRPRRGKLIHLCGRPSGLLLVVVEHPCADSEIALVRYDLTGPALWIARLPASLSVPSADSDDVLRLDAALSVGIRRLDRFTAQDAIGRHVSVQIDNVLWIGAGAAGVVFDSIRDRTGLGTRDVIAALWQLRAGKAVKTTLSTGFVVLALLRLRRLTTEHVDTIQPWAEHESLDAETALIVRRFLHADEQVHSTVRRTEL